MDLSRLLCDFPVDINNGSRKRRRRVKEDEDKEKMEEEETKRKGRKFKNMRKSLEIMTKKRTQDSKTPTYSNTLSLEKEEKE